MAPVLAGWMHFPQMKGLISGIILSGFGFSLVFYGYLSLHLVNPNNVEPEI